MAAILWMSSFMQNVCNRIRSYFSNYFHEQQFAFTEEELSEYMALTHLTKEQILRAYSHFCSMDPQYFNGEKNPFMSRAKVMNMPEFKVNPFKDRMMNIFSTYEDFMTFEDYLDMMSVLSEKAPIDLKAEYAFRIYDFDGDDMLSIDDLINLIKHLKEDRDMDEIDMKEAAVKALIDGDVDEDGYLAYTEFIHLVSRIDDFKSSFIIRL